MIYKQAQIDSYFKKPSPQIKAFLLYGTNEGLISEYSKKLALTVVKDLNDPFSAAQLLWDETKSDIGRLSSEYNSRSLMGDRRVIILKDADNDLTKPLTEILSSSNSDSLLIVCANSNINKKSSLLTFFNNAEYTASFGCYEDRDAGISSSARAYLMEQNITFDTEAFKLLCSRLSNDRKFNINELEKLITYVGTKKHFTIEDIKAVVFDQAVSGLEDFCFHTFSGNKQKSLNNLKYLISEDVGEINIIRGLIRHTNRLLEGKALLEKGERATDVSKKLLPKNLFFYQDEYARQLTMWNKDRLFDVMDRLYKTEKDCKSTNFPTVEILTYTTLTLLNAASKLKN